jgi:ketosteroid isomerase-like protein
MTSKELEKRIGVLEDLEEIRKLQRQYMYWLDAHEFDKVVGCFTEDAVAKMRNNAPCKGKKEIADLYKTPGKGMENHAHFVGQSIISLDGDRATGYWNVLILFSEPVHWVQGRNECEYVKENGNWKFRKLKFRRIKVAPPAKAP